MFPQLQFAVMLYERSRQIEDRLDKVLHLIEAGQYSTPQIAAEIGVSIPTISRCVTALRERGNDIRAEKNGSGWRYVLAADAHADDTGRHSALGRAGGHER